MKLKRAAPALCALLPFVFSALLTLLGCAPVQAQVAVTRSLFDTRRPIVREIIILDGSWSFARDLPAARDAAWQHAQRSVVTDRDVEIYILRVGGPPRGKKTTEEVACIRNIRSRPEAKRDFDAAFAGTTGRVIGGGTDWVGALNLARAYAALTPTPAAVHLLVFGDLIADPHKDPETHKLLQTYQRVETYDFGKLSGFQTITCLYADDGIRLALQDNASFAALGATLLTTKEARARGGVIPPPPHVSRSTAGTSTSAVPWAFYGIAGILIIALAVYLVQSSPKPGQKGTN